MGVKITDKTRARSSRAKNETVQWLESFLTEGPKTFKEVRRRAGKRNCSWTTVQRARVDLGVESVHRDKACWWQLPSAGSERVTNAAIMEQQYEQVTTAAPLRTVEDLNYKVGRMVKTGKTTEEIQETLGEEIAQSPQTQMSAGQVHIAALEAALEAGQAATLTVEDGGELIEHYRRDEERGGVRLMAFKSKCRIAGQATGGKSTQHLIDLIVAEEKRVKEEWKILHPETPERIAERENRAVLDAELWAAKQKALVESEQRAKEEKEAKKNADAEAKKNAVEGIAEDTIETVE